MRKQDFINLLIADIKEENKKRGNKLFNSVILAQACLETGWGSSTRMLTAKAVFGIKATSSWKGKVYNSRTHEVYSGKDVVINGSFRAYNSYRESISDYMDLIYGSSRYQKALNCKDYVECILEIRNGGYATDLNYVNKIINIIRYNNLTKYDFMDYEVETEKKTYLKYQIKSGDTLTKIATKFNTTVDYLVRLNSIKDPNKIFEGDIILVTEFSQKFYKIKYGDTLSSIARKFNTTVDHLCDINNIKNPNKIYAGRNIKI